MMQFTVIEPGSRSSNSIASGCELTHNHWDDWFRYETSYYLAYTDRSGTAHDIGPVRIGQFGMGFGHRGTDSDEDRPGTLRKPQLPPAFDRLSRDGFFSLGQGTEYYEALNELDQALREEVLTALNDIAYDERLFERALQEKVTTTSLLRGIPRGTV